MKVKDVIDKCEELLEVNSAKEDLLSCFNIIEHELALEYLPLYETHQCNSKVVKYSELEYNPVRIIACSCGKFKLYPTYIEGKETITEIKYAYTPHPKSLYDECSYNEDILKCITYGTVAEYLTSQGFYEEAILWNEKYKKEIKLLMF